MFAGLVFRYSASSGTGAWLGTPTGTQRSADRAVVHERAQVAFDPSAGRPVASSSRCAGAVLARGRRPQRRPATIAPAAIHQRRRGSPRSSSRPAEHARAAEDAQDRRGEERVARVDRQPGGRERGEHDHRDDARRSRPGAPARAATAATAPPRARPPTSTGGRRISPMRRGMYSGTLAIPVTRSSVSAVCRVLVSDHSGSPVTSQVAEHPHQRRAREQRSQPAGQAHAVSARDARSAQQVQPVQAREHPRLRAQQPGERQQRRAPAPPARRRRVSTSSAPSTSSR